MLYLSDKWISATAEALGRAEPIDAEVSIGYRVTGGANGDREYTLVCGPTRATCLPGLVDPSVVFLTDWLTAVAIATGTRSSQRAFLAGQLELTGDANLLINQDEGMASLDSYLDGVRARTVYE